jgi:hypothetical protein
MIVTAMSASINPENSMGWLPEEHRLYQFETQISPVGLQTDALLIKTPDGMANGTRTTLYRSQTGLFCQFDVIVVYVVFDGVSLAVLAGHGSAMAGQNRIRVKVRHEDVASRRTNPAKLAIGA